MGKRITPVDKYELRNALINIPGVWVCEHGLCIPVKDLNNAIDDMASLSKEDLIHYILKSMKSNDDPLLDEDLGKLLTIDEVREYAGMKPLGFEEYLEV